MRQKREAGWAAAIAAFLIVIFFISAGSAPARADNARWGANYFPNVVLITQDGAKVRFYEDVIKGKIVVIDLIYTHCVDACPLETARLVQVQKMLGERVGKDIFFYSISIDPGHDTPKVLKEYAEKYHVGPGWTFLTGKKDDIDLVSRKLGLYSEPDPNNRDGHTPSVLVGNEPSGQWIRNSATDNPRFLANMIGGWLDNWKVARNTQGAAVANTSYAEAKPIDLGDPGRYIFAKQCAACHTIGHGDKIGPDLLGVTSIRERRWLERFIATPDKLLAEKDPIAAMLFEKYNKVNMPNLRMADVDLKNLIDFLERQSTAQDKESGSTDKDAARKAQSSQPIR